MPEFEPGESKTAVIVFSNRKDVAFNCTAYLYVGTDEVSRVQFNLDAREEKQILMPAVMPLVPGVYPVQVAVYNSTTGLLTVQQSESVVIKEIVEIMIEALPFDTSGVGPGESTWRALRTAVIPADCVNVYAYAMLYTGSGIPSIRGLRIVYNGVVVAEAPTNCWLVPISFFGDGCGSSATLQIQARWGPESTRASVYSGAIYSEIQ